jgi:putative transposase
MITSFHAAKIARLVVPDYPHHITQRGNYRQGVFKDDADRRRYLELIASYSKKFDLAILCYCLMNNHVHFVAVPKNEDSMARTFSIAHTRYSQYFNNKMRANGHLWQGRFYSCVLDDRRLAACARYVERNPVRAHIVKHSTDYTWSSAKEHVDKSYNGILDTSALFDYIDIGQNKWKEFIDQNDATEDVLIIRKYTMTGRPLGGAPFIKKLEARFNIRLHALSVGRPKKANKK